MVKAMAYKSGQEAVSSNLPSENLLQNISADFNDGCNNKKTFFPNIKMKTSKKVTNKAKNHKWSFPFVTKASYFSNKKIMVIQDLISDHERYSIILEKVIQPTTLP